MFRDNWALDPLSLVLAGVTAYVGFRSGKNRAKDEKFIEDQQNQIDRLRKEVEDLKKTKDKYLC